MSFVTYDDMKMKMWLSAFRQNQNRTNGLVAKTLMLTK